MLELANREKGRRTRSPFISLLSRRQVLLALLVAVPFISLLAFCANNVPLSSGPLPSPREFDRPIDTSKTEWERARDVAAYLNLSVSAGRLTEESFLKLPQRMRRCMAEGRFFTSHYSPNLFDDIRERRKTVEPTHSQQGDKTIISIATNDYLKKSAAAARTAASVDCYSKIHGYRSEIYVS